MSALLVVGADVKSVQQAWNPKLSKAGIDVIDHWDWASKPGAFLPEGCEGVLFLTGYGQNKTLKNTTQKMAESAGIPFVVADGIGSPISLLHDEGLTVNEGSFTQYVNGKVTLPWIPANPAEQPCWLKVIGMGTAQAAADSAYARFSTLTIRERDLIGAYVLNVDASGKETAPQQPRVGDLLCDFDGNPSGLAVCLFLCIPAGAVLAVKTPSKVYKALMGKGMASSPSHLAAWATGRRVRRPSEPSWNMAHLAMVDIPEKSVGPVVKADATVLVQGPSKDQVQIGNLEGKVSDLQGEVTRLEGVVKAMTKSFYTVRGKLGARTLTLTKTEKHLESLQKETETLNVQLEEAADKWLKLNTDRQAEALFETMIEADRVHERQAAAEEVAKVAKDALDALDAAQVEAKNYKREFKALRNTVNIMFKLGPDTTIHGLYSEGYYVIKSRHFSPNVDPNVGPTIVELDPLDHSTPD